jgi:hypothetical protein
MTGGNRVVNTKTLGVSGRWTKAKEGTLLPLPNTLRVFNLYTDILARKVQIVNCGGVGLSTVEGILRFAQDDRQCAKGFLRSLRSVGMTGGA